MSASDKAEITYRSGALYVPHWGFTLRSLFGAAVANHDIANDGRLVRIFVRGTYVGEIQLKDKEIVSNIDVPAILRKPARKERE